VKWQIHPNNLNRNKIHQYICACHAAIKVIPMGCQGKQQATNATAV
jgi:hypothetical protein